MSPVRHLITYAQECRSLHPSLHTYFIHFGQTMGDSVQGWYQLPSIQRIDNWMELQDAFLLRFLARQRYRMHQNQLPGLQFNGEDTRHYINVWRDDLWGEPIFLLQSEELEVQECVSTAYYPRDFQTFSFLQASEYAESQQLQATYIPHEAQFFEERGIQYKLEYLRQANSALLRLFPDMSRLQHLGWPRFKLFDEVQKHPIGHLCQYQALVNSLGRDDEYATRNFVFSLTTNSSAFSWIARLPEEAFSSWQEFCDIFTRRFYQSTSSQDMATIRQMQPLQWEPLYDYCWDKKRRRIDRKKGGGGRNEREARRALFSWGTDHVG